MKTQDFMHEMRNTSAVLGRNSDVTVVFEGDQAHTDGSEIVLPSLPQDLTLDDDVVKVMRGYTDHEAGHIRHTDFEVLPKMGELGGQPLVDLHNVMEDEWLEPRVMEEYQGSEKNLKGLNEFIKGDTLKQVNEAGHEVLQGINGQTVATAISSVSNKIKHGGENNQKVLDLLPDNLKEHAERWVDEVRKCENSEEVSQVTRAVYKYLEQDPELEQSPDDFDPEDFEMEQTQAGKNYQEGEDGGEGKGQGGPQEGEGQEGDHPLEGKQPDKVGQLGKEEALSELLGDRVMKEGNHKGKYRVFSYRDDKVISTDSELKDSFRSHCAEGDYDTKKGQVQSHINVMRSKLRRALLARENRDWNIGQEQGRLDTKRLVQGYNGSHTVYKTRKDRDEMDTAIEVLIDLSGSMIGGRATAATQMTIALAECFEGTQLKYEITGFSNGGYTSGWDEAEGTATSKFHRVDTLNTFIFKGFDDKLFNKRQWVGRIDGFVGGGNSDYDAVQLAHHRLQKRPESRKILLVLSDGQPANSTSNDVGYRELERHLKEYVASIKDCECIGVGIETKCVQDFYPDHVLVENIEEFSDKVMGKLTKILTNGRLKG